MFIKFPVQWDDRDQRAPNHRFHILMKTLSLVLYARFAYRVWYRLKETMFWPLYITKVLLSFYFNHTQFIHRHWLAGLINRTFSVIADESSGAASPWQPTKQKTMNRWTTSRRHRHRCPSMEHLHRRTAVAQTCSTRITAVHIRPRTTSTAPTQFSSVWVLRQAFPTSSWSPSRSSQPTKSSTRVTSSGHASRSGCAGACLVVSLSCWLVRNLYANFIPQNQYAVSTMVFKYQDPQYFIKREPLSQ